MRAYIVAGRPQLSPPLKAYGRFEAWSGLVRASLVWLGCKDPCATREQIQDDDAEAEILSALLVALFGHFEGSIFTVSELVKAAKSKNQNMFDDGAADTAAALREALSPFERQGEVNTRSIGNIFRSHKERIVSCDGTGGKLSLRIRPVGKRHGSVTWRVERPPMAREVVHGVTATTGQEVDAVPRQALRQVLAEWRVAHGVGKVVSIGELLAVDHRGLRAALLAVAAMPDSPSPTISDVRLGRWLRDFADVHLDGLFLQYERVDGQGSQLWSLRASPPRLKA
jgi:hypothetical protein